MNQNDNEEPLLTAFGAALILASLGFQPKASCDIPRRIRSINPTGSTNLFDAMLESTDLLVRLGQNLATIGAGNFWNIVHVVLTDGGDTGSTNSLEKVKMAMQLISEKLNVRALKTWLIGVDLDENSRAARDMREIANAGSTHAEFQRVRNMEIGDIFERIRVSLGQIRSTQVGVIADDRAALIGVRQRVENVLVVEKQSFVVLFTLDISGMSGNSWTQVCDSVTTIINNLGEEDLIGCMVFNDSIQNVLNYKENPQYRVNINPAPPPVQRKAPQVPVNPQRNNSDNLQPLSVNSVIRRKQKRRCHDWPWYYFLPLVILIVAAFCGVIVLIFVL